MNDNTPFTEVRITAPDAAMYRRLVEDLEDKVLDWETYLAPSPAVDFTLHGVLPHTGDWFDRVRSLDEWIYEWSWFDGAIPFEGKVVNIGDSHEWMHAFVGGEVRFYMRVPQWVDTTEEPAAVTEDVWEAP